MNSRQMYLLLPFVHEAVEEEPEELLPVLCGVEAPVLGLLLVQADQSEAII